MFTALGRDETGLTRGLAAVLAAHPETALALLDSPDIRRVLVASGVRNRVRPSSLSVDAEEIQPDRRRRDVVVRAFRAGEPTVTLIVEAKGVSLDLAGRSVAALRQQLDAYLETRSDADADGDVKVGLALTTVRNLGGDDRVATMTWSELAELLHGESRHLLARQFRDHVLMSSGLRHYDVEVLSVPAGVTLAYVDAFRVHAHPADRKSHVALYLAPRAAGGGEVSYLYGIETVFDLDLRQRDVQVARLRQDDPHLADRVEKYLDARAGEYPDEVGETVLRVYALAEKAIPLPHKPKPKRNQPGTILKWRLADFLDPALPHLPVKGGDQDDTQP